MMSTGCGGEDRLKYITGRHAARTHRLAAVIHASRASGLAQDRAASRVEPMKTGLIMLVLLLLGGSHAGLGAQRAAGKAIAPADDGRWTMPGRDFAATRYSGLAQLTTANVARLQSVWNFSTGVIHGHEGQPLVVNNTMYVVTPYPDVLYAFDLTKPDYPLKWKYRPAVDPNVLGIACCDAINRGAVYADGKIVYNLLDGHTVAIDAATGRGALEHEDRRHHRGRDHADGAARHPRPGDRGTVGRRIRHSRLGQGARPRHRQGRSGRPTTKAPTPTCSPAPARSSRSMIGAPTWASRPGPRTSGRTRARRCGAGCPTTPTSICCTTASAIPGPTIPSSDPATTSGPTACWRDGPGTARWCGPTSSRRTTTGTTTRTRR